VYQASDDAEGAGEAEDEAAEGSDEVEDDAAAVMGERRQEGRIPVGAGLVHLHGCGAPLGALSGRA